MGSGISKIDSLNCISDVARDSVTSTLPMFAADQVGSMFIQIKFVYMQTHVIWSPSKAWKHWFLPVKAEDFRV